MFCCIFLFVCLFFLTFPLLNLLCCFIPTPGSQRTAPPAAAEFWLRADHTVSTWLGTSSWRKASCSTSWWGRRERTRVPPWVSRQRCCLADSWKNEFLKPQKWGWSSIPTPGCGCTFCKIVFFPRMVWVNHALNCLHWSLQRFSPLCVILLICHQVWNVLHHLSPRGN